MTGPFYVGRGPRIRVPSAGGGYGPGARMQLNTSCGGTYLYQLSGFGYVFPTVNWDDAGFVKLYGDQPNRGLANDAAKCFVLPVAGRYRITWYAYPLTSATGMAIGLSLDSLSAAWADAPTTFLEGANAIGSWMTMDVPGAVGDIWVPMTQVGGSGEGLYPGSFASIQQIG